MGVWAYVAGIAALAVVVFAARSRIRRLYAPPQVFLGLSLLTGGAFVGIMASALWKEERNRADGLPGDHMGLPECLDWFRRTAFGAGAVGAAWVAHFMAGKENWETFPIERGLR